MQNRIVRQLQEVVQETHPIGHVHQDAPLGPIFRQIEVGGHNPVQLLHVRLAQVILGYRDVRLQNLSAWRVLPGRQAHVNLGRIGGGADQFRCRLAGDCPVQLVLHGGEELLGHRRVRAVIHRQGVDVRDLLVKSPFAGPNLPDALQQFVEVILSEDLLALFQPFVIQYEALDDELP